MPVSYVFIHQIDDKRQALPLEHLNLETESTRVKAKPGRTLVSLQRQYIVPVC